jgi:hypothetical protein
MVDHLTVLTEYIQEKYPESQYLYKSCYAYRENWIVVLQLTKNSKSTQSRLRANHPTRKCARFRANELTVVAIINKFDHTKTRESIENTTGWEAAEYVVGMIAKSGSFDDDLNEIETNGIHFFESIAPAFFYQLDLSNYTGRSVKWYWDGQTDEEGLYLNGKKTGSWTYWYHNGQKQKEGNFLNGEKTGCWTEWYKDGQKKSEESFLHGRQHGKWTRWYENGKKESETSFMHGRKHGKWTFWHENEEKI